MRKAGPDTVEDWLAPAKVSFFHRQFDERCAKLAQTKAEEQRMCISMLIDDLAV